MAPTDHMTRAYVLANASLKQETELVNALRKIEHVTEVDAVYGKYDLIVTIDAESMQQVRDVVIRQIRGAYSAIRKKKKEHIATCGVCSGFFSQELALATLSPAESRHLLEFLKFYTLASDPLRSTLTLIGVGESKPLASRPVAQRNPAETQK